VVWKVWNSTPQRPRTAGHPIKASGLARERPGARTANESETSAKMHGSFILAFSLGDQTSAILFSISLLRCYSNFGDVGK
jgi:hypothetical protein